MNTPNDNVITVRKASDLSLTELAVLEGKWAKGQGTMPVEINSDIWANLKDYVRMNPEKRDYYTGWHKVLVEHSKVCPKCTTKQFCLFEHDNRPKFVLGSALVRLQSKGKGHVKSDWELCLTYSPKWYPTVQTAKEALLLAEERLLKYYKDELVYYRSVGEYTESGQPHLHVLYRLESGGKFTDKNLRRAYPQWNSKVKVGKGNQGGHHAPVEKLSDYAGYIEKHLDTAWHTNDINNAAPTQVS